MQTLHPRQVTDKRSWTTKEDLQESLSDLPAGARIYVHNGDSERSHGDDHLVGCPADFFEIRTKEVARTCRGYLELIVVRSDDHKGEAGWLIT